MSGRYAAFFTGSGGNSTKWARARRTEDSSTRSGLCRNGLPSIPRF